MSLQIEVSSFRDRDGFVFFENGRIFRAIHQSYYSTWDELSSTGLLNELSGSGKLVTFAEIFPNPAFPAMKVLEVEKIPFISYPGEWTITQRKKAALLTIDMQLKALEMGFSLKDASAFNVQFKGTKPVFIDLLSFERYEEGKPWAAYRQFCTHFLCPLLLHNFNIPGARQLRSSYIDGIPLDVCSGLLPFRSRFNLLAFTHIYMHARMQKKYEGVLKRPVSTLRLPKNRLVTMLVHMRDSIKAIKTGDNKTNWSSYYDDFTYSPEGFEVKRRFVYEALREIRPNTCLDLGCNTGEFSKIASEFSGQVIACDGDEQVVMMVQRKKIPKVLALCVDLTDPTPSRGWDNTERTSFLSRAGEADCVLALALLHHLFFAGNIPFSHLAEFFSRFKKHLIIEFVPKDDPQVSRLLVSRKDIFPDYTEENFVSAFTAFFNIVKKEPVPGCDRQLYHMKRTST